MAYRYQEQHLSSMRGFLPAKWKGAGDFEIGSGSSVGYAELGCGSGMVSYPFYVHILTGMKAANVLDHR